MKDFQNPKNFVVQLGALITLYISITSLLVLIFGLINLKFPDELDYYSTAEGVRESMRVSIAMLLVFFPTYIVLTRLNNQHRRQTEKGEYTTLAKWLIYLSLLVGGGIVLGDFVTIIIYLLNGEITTRFILKAFALLAIVGATLLYYGLDARNYFAKREALSIQCGLVATVLVVITLILGFLNIESPAEVRQIRLDQQQVNDLQDMQWRVEEYYRVEGMLPESVEAIYNGLELPKPPENRDAYTYRAVDTVSYELCATFVHASEERRGNRPAYPTFKDNYNWDHGSGEHCFKRVVEEETAPRIIEA